VSLTLRPETLGDHAAIYALTKRAFAPMPYAGGDEQDLINALRDAGALTLSLVAIQNDALVGHIAFSPAFAADSSPGWFALGPVSVAPEVQSQGIGAALIKAGIADLEARGAAGCILTGNPQYYTRFGFVLFPDLAPKEEPAEFFMILPMGVAEPTARMAFHPAFYEGGG
jgi:putative acetyltransferase